MKRIVDVVGAGAGPSWAVRPGVVVSAARDHSAATRVLADVRTLDGRLTGRDASHKRDLETLGVLLAVADQATAAAVALTARLAADGVAPQSEGLPLEQVMGLRAGRTYPDRRMLCTAADVLARLPVTNGLFHQGRVSWPQVRAIVAAARNLPAAAREGLDRTIADHVATAPADLDADVLVGVVDDAVDHLVPERAERDEQRRIEQSFVSAQPSFDGSLRLYAELDAEAGTTVLAAIDAAADPPTAAPDPDDIPEYDQVTDRPLPSRAQQRAAGLERVCAAYLGGDSGRPARPKLIVHVTAAALLEGRGVARLDSAVPGEPLRLTAAAARRLACDARMLAVAVLPDGSVHAGTEQDVIPKRLRTAVTARDGGCRMPGCRAPVTWCDAHHVEHRADGGPTVLANLVSLCRRHHTLLHRTGWRATLHADGTFDVRYRRRPPHRSLPRIPLRT